MNEPNLAEDADIDFASVQLNYDRFRELARNANISANGKIGFPDDYRIGFETAIIADIELKLPALQNAGATIIDIGPGCSIAQTIIQRCAERKQRIVLVDSSEMLDCLPDLAGVTIKCPGKFPENLAAVESATGKKADALICYSVLHYMYVDTNLFDVLDGIMSLLAEGGRALIGDIPNFSKRRRFFATDRGRLFHKAFMQTNTPPDVRFNEPVPGKIDDAVLMGLMQRAQTAGCDAYLLPQPANLPLANRRDDLLIVRP